MFVGSSAQAGNEVVFEHLDCSFGRITLVVVGPDKLVVDAFGLDRAFERGLASEFLEKWFEALCDEVVLVEFVICLAMLRVI